MTFLTRKGLRVQFPLLVVLLQKGQVVRFSSWRRAQCAESKEHPLGIMLPRAGLV